jgi:hypothetical protein
MEVIPQGIDPDWHESHLLIQVMNIGPVPRKELFNRVREQQSKKVKRSIFFVPTVTDLISGTSAALTTAFKIGAAP